MCGNAQRWQTDVKEQKGIWDNVASGRVIGRVIRGVILVVIWGDVG